MEQGPEAAPGLAWKALSAWADMGGAMRRLLARQPSESALLLLMILSGLFLFLLVLAEYWLNPREEAIAAGSLAGLTLAGVAVFGLVWPLVLYLAALLGHAVARGFGGTGDGRASRAAMAWAAFVAAPVTLLASLAGHLLAPVLPEAATGAVRSLGVLAFAWALAQCFAAAHGFSRPWVVLGAAGTIVVGLGAALRAVAG
jgi:hypothetical protein